MNRVKFTAPKRQTERDTDSHWILGAQQNMFKETHNNYPFSILFPLGCLGLKIKHPNSIDKGSKKTSWTFPKPPFPKNATVATQYRKGGDGTESVRTRRVQKMSCPVESWLGGGIGFEPGSYGIYFFCGPCGIIMIWRKLKMDHFL